MIANFLNLGLILIFLVSCGQKSTENQEQSSSVNRPKLRELGRQLFSERALSLDGTMSCRTCHEPRYAFTDRKNVPAGVTGLKLPRNSPQVLYAGMFTKFTWANPVLESLEEQVLVPLFGESPPEQHIGPREGAAYREVFASESRQKLRLEAAAELTATVSDRTLVVSALAAYVRSLSPFSSPYDRYLAGDGSALSERQKTGLQLFNGKASCAACHSGPLFNGQSWNESRQAWSPNIFDRNGLSEQKRSINEPLGLAEFTQNPGDWNKFRVPSLRNVAQTAPYLHDGSRPELSRLLDEYNQARNLNLNDDEIEAIKVFLESLSDPIATLMEL